MYAAGWVPSGDNQWTCVACKDAKNHKAKQLVRHEETKAHKAALLYDSTQQESQQGSRVEEHSLSALNTLLDDMIEFDHTLSSSLHDNPIPEITNDPPGLEKSLLA